MDSVSVQPEMLKLFYTIGDTGGGKISPGDNFAGENFARGKFRHP